MSSRPLKAWNAPGSMNRLPMSTSSSGKARTARRNWAEMSALSTWSRLELRLTEANPHSRHGVPPMRSRVQKENPTSLVVSRTWVMSTQASGCLDSRPMSKPAGPSVTMSAISASSASERAVQSLVSTSSVMPRYLSSPTWSDLHSLRGYAWYHSTRRPRPRRRPPRRTSEAARAEQLPQLPEEAAAGVDPEPVGQPDALVPHVEEHLGVARMLAQDPLEPVHPVVGQ